MASPVDVVVLLPSLVSGVPPPPAGLDPFLDAAARCFERYGVRRTSVQDIALEVGVNRTTVYRQVGTVEQVARLLFAREMHRMLEWLPERLEGGAGPEVVVDLLAAVVEYSRRHPVAAKVLADEHALIGPFLVQEIPELATEIAAAVAPLLDFAISGGQLARRDPVVVAEWLVRIGITMILAPPPGDPGQFLAELLIPALTPEREEA
jgi:AcrR family transcriptional regulator